MCKTISKQCIIHWKSLSKSTCFLPIITSSVLLQLKGCVIPGSPVWISSGKFKYSSILVEVVVFEPTFRDLPKIFAIGLLTRFTQDRLVWDVNEWQTYISTLQSARAPQSWCGHNRPHPNTIRVNERKAQRYFKGPSRCISSPWSERISDEAPLKRKTRS